MMINRFKINLNAMVIFGYQNTHTHKELTYTNLTKFWYLCFLRAECNISWVEFVIKRLAPPGKCSHSNYL